VGDVEKSLAFIYAYIYLGEEGVVEGGEGRRGSSSAIITLGKGRNEYYVLLVAVVVSTAPEYALLIATPPVQSELTHLLYLSRLGEYVRQSQAKTRRFVWTRRLVVDAG